MATCLKIQNFAAFPATTSSTKTAYSAMTIDAVASPDSCPFVMVSGTEYSDLVGISATRITSLADAEAILAALLVVLVVAFGVRMIRKVLEAGHVSSDEKF